MAPLRTKNTSRPTPPDNSAEQSGIAQSSQRMRTRPGNANKHPGLVDLEDEDQRGKTKQSGRRGSGVKATKNMNDMDRLVSGMTTDQRSALMKIVQGAMLGNNIPQGTASVTTLEEHHHSIATEQGSSKQDARAPIQSSREKTEEPEVDDEDCQGESPKNPMPLHRTYGQLDLTEDLDNHQTFTSNDFSDFERIVDEPTVDEEHAEKSGNKTKDQLLSVKQYGKRKAMEERTSSEPEDGSDQMSVDDEPHTPVPVVHRKKKARTSVQGGLLPDWEMRVSGPSVGPTLHSTQGHASASLPSPEDVAESLTQVALPPGKLARRTHGHARSSSSSSGVVPNPDRAHIGSISISTQRRSAPMTRTTEQMSIGVELKGTGAKKSMYKAEPSPDKGRKRITRTSELPLPADKPDAELLWTNVVACRYIAYVGSLGNPWDADSLSEEAELLRELWHDAFGEELMGEDNLRKVRNIAGQRAYDWRNKISKYATKAVDKFLNERIPHSETKRKEYYAEYCSSGGSGPKCLYSDPEGLSGAYRSEIVLQAFAAHLEYTKGAMKDFGAPAGALALCAAAVERAFLMWKTGTKLDDVARTQLVDAAAKDTSRRGRQLYNGLQIELRQVKSFSDATWGVVTRQHSKHTAKLKQGAWDTVVSGASAYSQKVSAVVPASVEGGINEIEREMVLSDDD